MFYPEGLFAVGGNAGVDSRLDVLVLAVSRRRDRSIERVYTWHRTIHISNILPDKRLVYGERAKTVLKCEPYPV